MARSIYIVQRAGQRQRAFGRHDSGEQLRNAVKKSAGIVVSEALLNAYWKWRVLTAKEDFNQFMAHYNAGRNAVRERMDAIENPFVNAKKGEPYEIALRLPDFVRDFKFFGLEKAGLACERGEDRICKISGVPKEAGEYKIAMYYVWPGYINGMRPLRREFSLLVNPDPRELWEEKPCDPNLEYLRPDQEFATLVSGNVAMWAASVRGRSHAHAGKPRDDAFALGTANGWQIMAVADGAGSAEFSRRGAEIACKVALAAAQEKLASAKDLDTLFMETDVCQMNAPLWQPSAKKLAYGILPYAALEANKAIRKEAEEKQRDARVYATTLLLAMAKRCPGGWAAMSFQIGDGAMAMRADGRWQLLAEPDEGEYGGQTRFVTMNEIFESRELMRRLRVDFVQALDGLLLMTDGVSDARFQTLEGLKDQNLWQALWQELLALAKSPHPEPELLSWLKFWSKGNHDDRTIAIMAVES